MALRGAGRRDNSCPSWGGEARKGEARCNFDPVRLAGVTEGLFRRGPEGRGPGNPSRSVFFSHDFQGIESLRVAWVSGELSIAISMKIIAIIIIFFYFFIFF